MRGFEKIRGSIFLWVPFLLVACIAQKPIDLIFTESGKGAGVESGDIVKTALATPPTISSILNNVNQAVTILEFTVKENGSRDGYPLQIRTLKFTHTGTADIAELRFVLEGPGSNNTVATTSGNSIIFKDFGDIIITDGDQTGKTYQLKAQIRSSVNGATTDNQTIAVNISPSIDAEVIEASSNMLPSVAAFASGSAAITIVASELQGKSSFTGLIATHTNDFPGTQSIYATDVNGRVDTDFTASITISAHVTVCPNAAPGSLGGDVLAKSAVAGVASWATLTYTLTNPLVAESIRIRAQAAGVSDQCSAVVTVNP